MLIEATCISVDRALQCVKNVLQSTSVLNTPHVVLCHGQIFYYGRISDVAWAWLLVSGSVPELWLPPLIRFPRNIVDPHRVTCIVFKTPYTVLTKSLAIRMDSQVLHKLPEQA